MYFQLLGLHKQLLTKGKQILLHENVVCLVVKLMTLNF